MSDVTLTVESGLPAGITPTRTALATGNTYKVRNNGRVALLFEKSGANPCVVTVQTPATVGGLAVAERTFTVVASIGDIIAAKVPPSVYNDGNGDLNFTIDEGTAITCAVVAI